MTTRFSLKEWFEIAERGTRGDMVFDILYSWRSSQNDLLNVLLALDTSCWCVSVDECQEQVQCQQVRQLINERG